MLFVKNYVIEAACMHIMYCAYHILYIYIFLAIMLILLNSLKLVGTINKNCKVHTGYTDSTQTSTQSTHGGAINPDPVRTDVQPFEKPQLQAIHI